MWDYVIEIIAVGGNFSDLKYIFMKDDQDGFRTALLTGSD